MKVIALRFLSLWLVVLALLPGIGLAIEESSLLEPEQAFKFSAQLLDSSNIEVKYVIADGYYLYRNKFRFEITPSEITLGTPKFPPGKIKHDEFFGAVEIYRGEVHIIVPFSAGKVMPASLKAISQGCADAGICYPPLTQHTNLILASSKPARGLFEGIAKTAPADTRSVQGLDEAGRVAEIFTGRSFIAIVAIFFGSGLLLTFTPCMFPMIPILSGIIVGQGAPLSKPKAFLLSLAYVLGMAVTYAIAGVAAGLSGSLLSVALQNGWVLGSFALLFVLLALSMFGFYELQLPASLQSRFTRSSNRLPGGKLFGVFCMGILSALIVGPCLAAPLAGALLYIGQSHDVWLGGSALFAMGLGMGVPLLLVGVSAGALLPRAGAWMNGVKNFFGVVLLAVALWLISPLIAVTAQMLLWAALLIISAVYLRALDPLPATVPGFSRFLKGVGVILLCGGIALLIGGLSGAKDLLQPLSALNAGTPSVALPTTRFDRIKNVTQLAQRLQTAGGKQVMLDFYADWCVSCKEMEKFTFSDPAVAAQMNKLVLLQVDVTKNDADDKALLQRFNLFGPPGIIFFDAQGNEINTLRVVGFQRPPEFLRVLNALSQGSHD